jgi:hypothetical protein
MPPTAAINAGVSFALSLSLSSIQSITLFLSKLNLLQRMTSNDNSKHKLEEEAESSTAKKRLWLSDNDVGDFDSSDSLEEEEEETSSEETSMNQLNTSEEKLLAKRARGIVFGDDVDTTSPSSVPHTPKSRWHSDEDNNDDDDDKDVDFWI